MGELALIGEEVERQVAQLDPPSFCVECDAPEGGCSHSGARYHDSWFEYKTGPGTIDTAFKDWFARNDHGFDGQEKSGPKPRSLVMIVAELEPWVFLNDGLRERLEEAYALNPVQVSLMSAELRRSLEGGKIMSPGGTLVNRLKGIKSA